MVYGAIAALLQVFRASCDPFDRRGQFRVTRGAARTQHEGGGAGSDHQQRGLGHQQRERPRSAPSRRLPVEGAARTLRCHLTACCRPLGRHRLHKTRGYKGKVHATKLCTSKTHLWLGTAGSGWRAHPMLAAVALGGLSRRRRQGIRRDVDYAAGRRSF